MQPIEQLGRQVIAAVDDLGGARIGGARLALLGLGQRHRAQREDLVDLGRVEQVARALGRDLGMVGEDDRRREQERAIASGPASTGHERTFSHARGASRAHSGGSASETNAPPSASNNR
jgi:hypothetical protein